LVSLPRQILPGATVMVTRRCTQRQFLLAPSATVKQVFRYCLALASEAAGVIIHAACVLSNHYHLIVSDPEAKLPEFTYVLNKFVAKCLNAHYGRWENLFAAGTQASYVRLENADAILEKTVYAITNPVEAGLVAHSKQWPGINIWRPGSYVVQRPEVFFRDGLPQTLELRIEPIPLGPGLRAREVMERLGNAVAERESQIRARFRREHKAFQGVACVLAQSPHDSPRSREPRRGLSPLIAIRDKWRRIEILQRVRVFWQDYKVALAAWRAGERQVVFPFGVVFEKFGGPQPLGHRSITDPDESNQFGPELPSRWEPFAFVADEGASGFGGNLLVRRCAK
jgi:REP element-mobilizing transposase RayT